jgi:hypothetical protein
MLFSPSVADLERDFDGAKAAIAPGGTLWICWPKKASCPNTTCPASDPGRGRFRHGRLD